MCACSANYFVSSNTCTACPAGSARAAGDNPDGADTACTTCAADYYVSGGTCTACATGLFRLAGDVSTEDLDTACTYASPFASKAELVNTIASSYCLGGDATGATCTDGKGVAIASWDVSSVVDMAGLFQGCDDVQRKHRFMGHNSSDGHEQHVQRRRGIYP